MPPVLAVPLNLTPTVLFSIWFRVRVTRAAPVPVGATLMPPVVVLPPLAAMKLSLT